MSSQNAFLMKFMDVRISNWKKHKKTKLNFDCPSQLVEKVSKDFFYTIIYQLQGI